MQKISAGRALAAGFDLIRREPVAFLVWCGVYFLIAGAPGLLISGASIPMLRELAAAGGDMANPAVVQAQARAAALQPLSYLTYFALLLVLPGAVFRAVLRPEARRYFYLRIGAPEGWVLLVSLVLAVGWIVALVAMTIPIALVLGVVAAAAGAAGTAGAGVAIVLMVLAMVAVFGVSIWGALRLSLAPVMAFADRTFRLPESWSLTRGHAWTMFLVALALFALVLFVQLVVLGIGLGALAGSGALPGLAAEFKANPAALFTPARLPWLVLVTTVFGLLGGAFYVLWFAAWADMYRQLRPAYADAFD